MRLMRAGRTTWVELAQLLGFSAPAAADWVRRLEERGMIRCYSALVDPEAVGLGVAAFVAVVLEKPEHRIGSLEGVGGMSEVQECHNIAGEDHYLLKVRCGTMRDLEGLVSDGIKGLAGVVRTRTTVVLSTAKETPVLPFPLSPIPPPRRGRRAVDPSFLLRGVVLGFVIAAPVGPIGVLCIRRSLAEGRAAGLLCPLFLGFFLRDGKEAQLTGRPTWAYICPYILRD